jgi:hypothetical protein
MFIQVNMVILTFTMNSVFVLRTGTYIKWVHNRYKTSPSILTRIRYYQSSDYSLCISYVTMDPRGGDINHISDGLNNPSEA